MKLRGIVATTLVYTIGPFVVLALVIVILTREVFGRLLRFNWRKRGPGTPGL